MNKILISICLIIVHSVYADEKGKQFKPMLDKKVGIEINPYLLFNEFLDRSVISGSISIFNLLPDLELSLPYIFQYGGWSTPENREENNILILDLSYRNYWDKYLRRVYFNLIFRYGYFVTRYYPDHILTHRESTIRIGPGIGFGYKYMSKWGTYWGTSFSMGLYLTGEYGVVPRVALYWSEVDDVFVSIEMLKIGYAF